MALQDCVTGITHCCMRSPLEASRRPFQAGFESDCAEISRTIRLQYLFLRGPGFYRVPEGVRCRKCAMTGFSREECASSLAAEVPNLFLSTPAQFRLIQSAPRSNLTTCPTYGQAITASITNKSPLSLPNATRFALDLFHRCKPSSQKP